MPAERRDGVGTLREVTHRSGWGPPACSLAGTVPSLPSSSPRSVHSPCPPLGTWGLICTCCVWGRKKGQRKPWRDGARA